MPAGPIGSVWASGTWTDTCWEADTWADAVVALLTFALDLNTRLRVFLDDFYGTSGGDLPTLAVKYLQNEVTGDFNARWHQMVQDATDAAT